MRSINAVRSAQTDPAADSFSPLLSHNTTAATCLHSSCCPAATSAPLSTSTIKLSCRGSDFVCLRKKKKRSCAAALSVSGLCFFWFRSGSTRKIRANVCTASSARIKFCLVGGGGGGGGRGRREREREREGRRKRERNRSKIDSQMFSQTFSCLQRWRSRLHDSFRR